MLLGRSLEQGCLIELFVAVEMFQSSLFSMVASTYVWLLSTYRMTSIMEELDLF